MVRLFFCMFSTIKIFSKNNKIFRFYLLTIASMQVIVTLQLKISTLKQELRRREMERFEIRWIEINKKMELVNKRKGFDTEKARDKFVEKLVEKDNYYGMLAYSM